MTDECKWSYTKDGNHREFILPGPFSQAAGKRICQDCCKYLGWNQPVEKTVTPVTPDDRDTIHLLQAETLPDWETKFISDVAKRHEWSEKQRTIFDRIKNQHLKTTAKTPSEAPSYELPDDALDLF